MESGKLGLWTLDISAFHRTLLFHKQAERRNFSIYRNYARCLTLSYFFSKIVGQGKNVTVNSVFTTFTLSHIGLEQLGTPWNGKSPSSILPDGQIGRNRVSSYASYFTCSALPEPLRVSKVPAPGTRPAAFASR